MSGLAGRPIASKYTKYKLLRKYGLNRIKAVLLATRRDFKPELYFNPDLLKIVKNLEEVEKHKKKPEYEKELEKHKKKLEEYENTLAEKTDNDLKKFLAAGHSHHDFFFKTKPTIEEFFNLLVLGEGLPPGEAVYESLVCQNASKYLKKYGLQGVTRFSLGNWASWKAKRIAEILFNRDLNRENNNEEKKRMVIDDLKNAFDNAVSKGEAPQIELKIFWGGHKEKEPGTADEEDERLLDRLKGVADSLQKMGVDARVKLIFSDLHSEKINDVERERINKYFDSLKPLAEKRGFGVELLSNLWNEHNPFKKWFKEPAPGEKPALGEKPLESMDALGFTAKTLNILEKMGIIEKSVIAAARHSQEVAKGKESAFESSEKYHALMLVEKFMFERLREQGTFFISLSNPRSSALYKPQYTLYFWSKKRGTGKSPWFK